MERDDHAFAGEIADGAGRLLLRLRAEHGSAGSAGHRGLRDAGDRGAHDHLMDALARGRPADAVLSEEGRDDLARLDADRVWIVDPLDGTREYAEEGRTDWAVHVALWERGELVAGAVALPAQRRTLTTADPPRPAAAPRDVPRITVSRTRPPELVTELANRLGAELVPLGSAGAKIAAVLLGDVDAYVHGGGQYEWDSAAPVAVALAAGAHASRLDGSALTYNETDPLLPDILVSHPTLAPALLAGVQEVAGATEVPPAERKTEHAS